MENDVTISLCLITGSPLMTKYGHESGSIAISQLRAGIDDKNHFSKNIIEIHIFSILT